MESWTICPSISRRKTSRSDSISACSARRTCMWFAVGLTTRRHWHRGAVGHGASAYRADRFTYRPDHHVRPIELDVMRCVGHELVAAVRRPRGFVIVQCLPGDLHAVALITRQA